MNRLLRLAAAAAAAAIAVAACSSGADSSSAAPGAAATSSAAAPTTGAPGGGEGTNEDSGTITIQNFSFGEPITVAPGATVKVTNQDVAAHDAVSDDGRFTTPLLEQGESATFTTPAEPGTYEFSCSVHATMTGIGTLVVSG